ncbi:hypothetical protein D9V37_04970 [Nocardioides mangrovicus]|uniref:Restriction system protein Mrr-like N-terminal domain-containing protein n=1 Tax=Nocardioides mangrovicus TaxID=2478913 RepID=A0A3L8P5Z6_9ACTN|nr:hypothetical protein [Nocardioides mangrovicus]RLV50402.1 hypothetical protein D9V37_04970 [Nocardioides mangrovicus]
MSEEWCDHCDLPLATCVHGRPPAPPAAAAPKPARQPRARREPAAPRKKATAGVVVRRSARTMTPAASFRPHILAVLDEHDGECEAEALLAALHERMEPELLEQDLAIVNGEVRWRQTARRERAAMTTDGLLAPPRTPGVWELS